MKLLHKFFLFLLLTIFSFSSVNIIKDITLEKSELKIHANYPINIRKVKHFMLPNPTRDVYDFHNMQLKDRRISKYFPENIRIAQFKSNTVRIVIENSKPTFAKGYVPILSKNRYHIPLADSLKMTPILEIHKNPHTINEIFSEVEMLNSDNREKYRMEHQERKPVTIVTSATSTYKKSNRRDLIVIDAGHGGHDGGATAGGKREKDLVLSVAKRVGSALKKRGYRIYLTRSDDRFLKLSERTKIADRKNAVAFISIHANSVLKRKRHRVHGIETFFLQNTRDAKSQRIASRENAAVLKGAGTNLSKAVIVDSVLNGPKIIESNKLAIDVQRRIISNVRSRYTGIKDGGVRHAPFYVLVGASRPSILVEVGYISHPKERKRLFTASYQKLIAKGIAEGVDNYLNTRKKEIDID